MDYKQLLNEKQYEAVTSNAQFLRIIAGAGSGKTRVLTFRIAYLIDKMYVNPRNILAITFTNKVANEMKDRTISLLNGADLSGLTICTFHSWCARFLRSEIEVLGFPRNFMIMDDDDQLSLVKNIGETFGYKRTDDRNKAALAYICAQKCYGKLPSDAEKSIFGHEEDIKYFKEYEKRKNEMHELDFDDLMIYAIKILEAYPDIREKWINRYEHILIDEFQDTNDLQFRLLNLLTDSRSNVYVVGDPDQTIYTWRGANQDIIMNFDRIYSPTKTIPLVRNYRSTQNILDVANRLIANNKDRYKKDLYTENETGETVFLKSFDRSYDEANFIANKIDELKFKNKSLQYKDFAVLYRSSYLTNKLENVLVSKHIPYKVYGSLKFYQRAEIKDCIAYFKILVNEDEDIAFERIINVPRRKIGDSSINVIKVEAQQNGLSMIKYLKEIHKHDTELRSTVINVLNELFKHLEETREKLTQNYEAYSEVLNQFLHDIGYFSYLEEKDEDVDRVENVNSLLDDIRTYLRVHPESNFIEYLQNITLLSAQDDIDDSDSVSLMTVHTAKGLEFKYVFLMCFSDGVFPNSRSLNESVKALEEERRLAYVACTRAQKKLFVTLNLDYSFTSKSHLLPSRFIMEMGLKAEANSFNPFKDSASQYQSNGQKYVYSFGDKFNDYPTVKPKREESVIDLTPKNNITWNVGDICIHQAFGEGKVAIVEDNIITVDFEDFGRKVLLGNHPKLSKK